MVAGDNVYESGWERVFDGQRWTICEAIFDLKGPRKFTVVLQHFFAEVCVAYVAHRASIAELNSNRSAGWRKDNLVSRYTTNPPPIPKDCQHPVARTVRKRTVYLVDDLLDRCSGRITPIPVTRYGSRRDFVLDSELLNRSNNELGRGLGPHEAALSVG